MGQCDTTQFGVIDYDEAAVVHFPAGLPAFEEERQFLIVEQAETTPVVFLQSLVTPRLLFLTVPARFVDPAYVPELTAAERQTLGLDDSEDIPVEGQDLVSLAILTVKPGSPITANLLAPVVIGTRSRRAIQIIQPGTGYSVSHPLAGATASCS